MSPLTGVKNQAHSSSETLPPSPQSHPLSRFLKLMLDYLIVLPTVILIAPLLLVLAVAIKLDSKGPVLQKRQVLGRNGRVFNAYNFRTTFTNSAEILAAHPSLQAELARSYKLKCDPRITRVGLLLRQYNLDELPQLINVLRQEMSLIGPRLITPDDINQYGKARNTLLQVMPGLTGLWQISTRDYTSYSRRIQLDMEYIQNWSIWLDIKIMLGTIPAVLNGRTTH